MSLFLTERLHGLHQLQREGLVSGQLFQHPGHLVVPRPHDVVSVNALYVVAHRDDLHPVHHTALLDTLQWREEEEKVKTSMMEERQEEASWSRYKDLKQKVWF